MTAIYCFRKPLRSIVHRYFLAHDQGLENVGCSWTSGPTWFHEHTALATTDAATGGCIAGETGEPIALVAVMAANDKRTSCRAYESSQCLLDRADCVLDSLLEISRKGSLALAAKKHGRRNRGSGALRALAAVERHLSNHQLRDPQPHFTSSAPSLRNLKDTGLSRGENTGVARFQRSISPSDKHAFLHVLSLIEQDTCGRLGRNVGSMQGSFQGGGVWTGTGFELARNACTLRRSHYRLVSSECGVARHGVWAPPRCRLE